MRTIAVTQGASPPNLSISTTAWHPTSAVGAYTIAVTSNITWNVTSNQPWLTITNITPSNRTGSGSFVINANHINKLEGNDILMKNGETVPMRKNKRDAIRADLADMLSSRLFEA